VPVLVGLEEELLDQLARQVEEVHVPAGDWIMREQRARRAEVSTARHVLLPH
jgi:hypothetical protein